MQRQIQTEVEQELKEEQVSSETTQREALLKRGCIGLLTEEESLRSAKAIAIALLGFPLFVGEALVVDNNYWIGVWSMSIPLPLSKIGGGSAFVISYQLLPTRLASSSNNN